MSGITGIFRRDGKDVDPADITRMNDKISHRGPDGSKVWCEGPVALGHQMLHTTPESLHETLPFEDEESGLVITADARIDNRKDLAPQLGIEDNEYVSDSYFILKAYEKWGEKCPEELLGDFAFAIWDKNTEKLFCARDHMGVKPFYYYLSDEAFFYATEIKALFTITDVPYELNELKLAFHLMKDFTDKKLTFFKDVLSLTAAHSLIIDLNVNEIKKYWKLDPDSLIIMDSDESYIRAFRKIFSEAINCRLRSAHPIGFELSGGLDSSSVVCMAKHVLNKNEDNLKINTFSMIFNDFPQVDESFYIEKVTDACEITPHLIISDEISPLDKIETILWYQEQPFYTPNMTILWNMYRTMKHNGTRVILGGSGGDQIINIGRNHFRDLAADIQWKKLITEINSYSKNTNQSTRNILIGQVILPLTPTYLKNILKRFLILINQSNQDKDLIFNKEFIKRTNVKKYCNNILITPKTARDYHYFVIDRYSHQYFHEMRDKLASAFYIEPRYPFYDKRLVEFCYSLPNEMKFRFGWNRYIQRIAMENILPKEVQWRPLKNFFDPVFERNLLLFEKNRLEDIFHNENRLMDNYVDYDVLNIFYQKYKGGNGKITSNRDIWLVTLTDLWLRQSGVNIHD